MLSDPTDPRETQSDVRILRLIGLLAGTGALALVFDVWVAHFVGMQGDHPAQQVPIVSGLVVAVAMLVVCVLPVGLRVLRYTLRVAGLAAAATGLAGMAFHWSYFWGTYRDKALTLEAFEDAVSNAPPLFAPAGFVALGSLLVLAGFWRISIASIGSGLARDKAS